MASTPLGRTGLVLKGEFWGLSVLKSCIYISLKKKRKEEGSFIEKVACPSP